MNEPLAWNTLQEAADFLTATTGVQWTPNKVLSAALETYQPGNTQKPRPTLIKAAPPRSTALGLYRWDPEIGTPANPMVRQHDAPWQTFSLYHSNVAELLACGESQIAIAQRPEDDHGQEGLYVLIEPLDQPFTVTTQMLGLTRVALQQLYSGWQTRNQPIAPDTTISGPGKTARHVIEIPAGQDFIEAAWLANKIAECLVRVPDTPPLLTSIEKKIPESKPNNDRIEDLTNEDVTYLRRIWENLDIPAAWNMTREQWAMCCEAFNVAPDKPAWNLVTVNGFRDYREEALIERQKLTSRHFRQIEAEANAGRLCLLDAHRVPTTMIEPGTLISIDNARAYVSPLGFELVQATSPFPPGLSKMSLWDIACSYTGQNATDDRPTNETRHVLAVLVQDVYQQKLWVEWPRGAGVDFASGFLPKAANAKTDNDWRKLDNVTVRREDWHHYCSQCEAPTLPDDHTSDNETESFGRMWLRKAKEKMADEWAARSVEAVKRQQSSTAPAKDAGAIPGEVPKVASGRLAVQAAWEIECETSKRATAKEVMQRMRQWANDGRYGELTSPLSGNAVEWVTTKGKSNKYDLEACGKTLARWHESRQ